jgi:dihydrodipicolinate synthase/N-acetylneuraminate lyase
MLDGVLFFPVTPFGPDGTVDYEVLAEHVRRGLAAGPGGVFGDDETVQTLLHEFFNPLVRLRDAVPGYAVSLVKAGVPLGGLPAGSVRPPLVDPTPEHVEQLAAIIAAGRAAAAGLTGEVSRPRMAG